MLSLILKTKPTLTLRISSSKKLEIHLDPNNLERSTATEKLKLQ